MIDADGDGTADTAGHRIKFIFSDNTASGSWLKIDVLASGDVGLDADHTFYFGNLAGDMTGTGGIPDWSVGSADLDLVRANWGRHRYRGPVPGSRGDANSDEMVSSADLDIVRSQLGKHLGFVQTPPRWQWPLSLCRPPRQLGPAEADAVYGRYGLLDDDPTNDLAIDAKFWEDLYDALGLTFAA